MNPMILMLSTIFVIACSSPNFIRPVKPNRDIKPPSQEIPVSDKDSSLKTDPNLGDNDPSQEEEKEKEPSSPEIEMGDLMARPGWKLVWHDEFDGNEINSDNWNLADDGRGGGNNELQYYTPRADNAFVEDGRLVIKAKKETYSGSDGTQNYTSARLDTAKKADFLYGRIEARAKLPEGQGMWPAIWMLPTDWVYGGWASSGEIDIMEAVNTNAAGGNEIHGTIHHGDKWPGNTYTGKKFIPEKSIVDNYHVYAVEWDVNEIRWYVDDNLYSTLNEWRSEGAAFPAPFDKQFHIILNLAVGGNWPKSPNAETVFPQTLEVDYVRVYQRED